jgi:dTMP kinase
MSRDAQIQSANYSREIDELKLQKRTFEQSIAQLTSELERRSSGSAAESARLESSKKEAERSLVGFRERCEELTRQLQAKQRELEEVEGLASSADERRSVEDARRSEEASQLSATVEDAKRDAAALQRQLIDMQKQLQIACAERDGFQKEVERLDEREREADGERRAERERERLMTEWY